jgi:hypothetical protein
LEYWEEVLRDYKLHWFFLAQEKRIIVFDDPEPPRNAASHGVHNFLGLDGLLPSEIRKIAWKQIDKYDSAEFRKK